MSSSAGVGVFCWWYWSKTFILVKKNIFLCPPAACSPSLGGCPLLFRFTLVKRNIFISQKKPFCVSTEVCNLRRCTNSCPCKLPGPSSWVLDSIGQAGQPHLPLFLTGAVSMELLGPRGQYDGIQTSKILVVCLLACTLSVLPGLRKQFCLTSKKVSFD